MSEKEPKLVRLEHPGPTSFMEQVKVEGEMKYVCYQPPRPYQPEPKELIEYVTFHPVSSDDDSKITHYIPMKRCPWLLAGELKEPGMNLWEDVKGFINIHVDLPDLKLYDVLTAWILVTWIAEAFDVVGYLHILGPHNTGKTRLLEVLQHLCYRGMLSPSASEATLFRVLEVYHPTFLLDESEIYNHENRSSIQNILNAGYRRGQYVMRMKGGDGGEFQPDFFEVFGPKAIAGTGGLKKTLESRSIRITMERNTRAVNFRVDRRKAQDLRSRLLLWRFRRLHGLNINGDGSDVSDGSDPPREGYSHPSPELSEIKDGRIQEIFSSLITVATQGRQSIIDYAKEMYQIARDEEGSSVEAQILLAIIKCESSLESGKFRTSDVRAYFNDGKPEREQWKSSSIGRVIKRLGFKKKRMTGGHRGYIYDADKITWLSDRYDIPPSPEASPPSLLSPMSLEDQDQAQFTEQRTQIFNRKRSETNVSSKESP